MSKGVAIGIDVGATHFRVALCDENANFKLITDQTPCYARLAQDNEWIIGKEAEPITSHDTNTTVFFFKRLLGQSIGEVHVGLLRPNYEWIPFSVSDADKNNRKIVIEESRTGMKRNVSPIEIYSEFLRKAKESAEHHLKQDSIETAVLTVPDTFREEQRIAILTAARIAGLHVQLVHDSVAAAEFYGSQMKSGEEKKILIFDLGGESLKLSAWHIKKDNDTNIWSKVRLKPKNPSLSDNSSPCASDNISKSVNSSPQDIAPQTENQLTADNPSPSDIPSPYTSDILATSVNPSRSDNAPQTDHLVTSDNPSLSDIPSPCASTSINPSPSDNAPQTENLMTSDSASQMENPLRSLDGHDLGGFDFDVAVAQHVLSTTSSLAQGLKWKLLKACQTCRETLSTAEATCIKSDALIESTHFKRSDLEKCAATLISSIENLLKEVIRKYPEIEEIVTIGGASNMYCIQKCIENCIQSKSIKIGRLLEGYEAVVFGAASEAYHMQKSHSQGGKITDDLTDEEIHSLQNTVAASHGRRRLEPSRQYVINLLRIMVYELQAQLSDQAEFKKQCQDHIIWMDENPNASLRNIIDQFKKFIILRQAVIMHQQQKKGACV